MNRRLDSNKPMRILFYSNWYIKQTLQLANALASEHRVTLIFPEYSPELNACDGRVAMNKMQSGEYDLIITDFKMPQMSGRDLFNWIKENRPSLASRVIFVTGDTVSMETRSFFEDNKNLYLAKPFKIEEVKEVIQQMLEANAQR